MIVTSWVESLKSELGLTGVSQVWSDRPSWYFWVEGAPGVYHLEFAESGVQSHGGRDIFTARFIIKCYPYPGHRLFSSFAPFERELVQSDFFDKTHSPVFETREKIPPELFNVATFTLTTDGGHRFASFTFESCDRLLTVSRCNAQRDYPLLNFHHGVKPGAIERDVPGLVVGYPLFDRLLCMFTYAEKQVPTRIRLFHSPGFKFTIEPDAIRCVPSETVKGYHLTVDCGSGENRMPPDAQAISKLYDAKEKTLIYDRGFACGHFHPGDAECRLPVKLNPKWWTLARESYASHLASACGCQ